MKQLISVTYKVLSATRSWSLAPFHLINRSVTTCTSWKFQVQPYWELKTNLSQCRLEVKPHDISEKITSDELTISLQQLGSAQRKYDVVQIHEEKQILICNVPNGDGPDCMEIKVPAAFNLNILSNDDSDVFVSDMECDHIQIQTEHGNVQLNNIKATDVHVASETGNINSNKLLQGNGKLLTDQGNMTLKKLQGCQMTLNANGDISVQDVYADKLSIETNFGSVRLKSLHGDTDINTVHGEICVGTAEGRTKAATQHGNIDILVMGESQASLKVNEGDIRLSLVPDSDANVDITAEQIQHSDLPFKSLHSTQKAGVNRLTATLNSGGKEIKAEAVRGKVNVESSSWMQRMLKFPF